MEGYSIDNIHRWDLTPTEAIALQKELRASVRIEPFDAAAAEAVAGCDISHEMHSSTVHAGVVILGVPEFGLMDRAGVRTRAIFKYVPGLLSFRESPPLLEAWRLLTVRPDAMLVDGHGLAHPRRFGIACHLGALLDLPTVGVAKSVLVGKYDPPAGERGAWSPLIHKEEIVGAALRTQTVRTPIFVSIGHRVDLESAIELVLRCTAGYRLPEPTRQAHLFVNELRRNDRPPG